MNNRRIGTKLAGMMVVLMLSLAAVSIISLSMARTQMLTDRMGKTQNVVEMIAQYAAALDKQVAAGTLSHDAAMAKLVEVTHAQRYDKINYINIYNDAGLTIASPSDHSLVGTNRMGITDPNGVRIIEVARNIAREKGSGFYWYVYPRPGSTVPEPKLTYVQSLAPGGALFALSGIYVDDVDTAMWHQARVFGSAVAIVLLLAAIAEILIHRSIGTGLSQLGAAMGRLAKHDLTIQIPGADRADEIGQMAATVQVFKDAAIAKTQLEAEAEAQRDAAASERRRADTERAEHAAQQARVVAELSEGLERLSRGDLVIRLETPFAAEYETLRANFNSAMTQLHELVSAIITNTAAIRSGGSEISQAADDLSRRTEQQAASLEQTAAALDQITATVRRTADGAGQANGAVLAARQDAEHSGDVVRDAVTAMGEIDTSSKQISQIIGVIDEIAFQTNLLALNAGVEAARAGDAGRGFAVVASEVRALAQRSAVAAKEIKALISTSARQVGRGVELVDETGRSLGRIVAQVTQINGVVSEIAASAQEQARGLAEVNTAINQMDQVTQQNAAMVEQSTAASQSLAQETEALVHLTRRFHVGQIAGGAEPATNVEPLRKTAPKSALRPAKPKVVRYASQGRGSSKAAVQTEAQDGWEEF